MHLLELELVVGIDGDLGLLPLDADWEPLKS
jgi:hypothetical protein